MHMYIGFVDYFIQLASLQVHVHDIALTHLFVMTNNCCVINNSLFNNELNYCFVACNYVPRIK